MADDRTGSRDTPGGLPQERVEDRANVGIVKPEDYPEADREASAPEQAAIDDEQADIDQERADEAANEEWLNEGGTTP